MRLKSTIYQLDLTEEELELIHTLLDARLDQMEAMKPEERIAEERLTSFSAMQEMSTMITLIIY